MNRTATSRFLCWGLLTLLAGCGGSTAATLSSGRMVDATSDTITLSQSNNGDTATLNLGSIEVIVEPSRVLVDEQAVASLDPQVKRVSVTRAGGKVQVVADGTTIYNAPIR